MLQPSESRQDSNSGFVRVVGMFPELQFLVKGFISSFSAVFWGSILMWVAACLQKRAARSLEVLMFMLDSFGGRGGVLDVLGDPYVGHHRSLLDSSCEPWPVAEDGSDRA